MTKEALQKAYELMQQQEYIQEVLATLRSQPNHISINGYTLRPEAQISRFDLSYIQNAIKTVLEDSLKRIQEEFDAL